MKNNLLKTLIALSVATVSTSAVFAVTPSVTLFQHVGFEGASESFSSSDSDLRDNGIGNDAVSSLQVPQGCSVTLYQHINFEGDSENFTLGHADLRSNSTLGNDIASSIEVACAPVTPSVSLFQHVNFEGTTESFSSDDPDLRDNEIGNDAVSSLKVPAGCEATLFQHINYEGVSETFTAGDVIDLRGNAPIGNDIASSIKVSCGPIIPAPVANNDSGETTVQDTPVTVDVVANDTGDGLTLTSVGSATSGTTSIVNGEVVYTPNSGFVGTDSFTYTVTDSTGAQSQGTVNVTVTAAPAPLEVILYDGSSQSGSQSSFPAGDYPAFTSANGAIGNNDPSSIHIPVGCTVEIFRDPNFALVDANHDTIVLDAGDHDFPISNSSGQMADNSASSMKVDCGGA